jgi:beta-carotene hydroxylase
MKQIWQGKLRHKEDRRSLIFVSVTLVLLLLPLCLALPFWVQSLWLVVSSLFCFNACIINHNHIHHPVFFSTTLNTLFGITLSLAKGHTSTGVILAHNDNHHKHQGDNGDWIQTELAGRGIGIVRMLRYIVLASMSMAKGRMEYAATDLPRLLLKRIRLERLALILFALSLLYYSGFKALLFVGLPWILGMTMLVGVNLLQHDGCIAQSRYQHSRNFTGALGNWFFFNNGFHTIHHIHPNLHWSQLPQTHEIEVKPHIDASLEQASIPGFLFHHYVFRFTDAAHLPKLKQV